jgi:hypothetical protein
VIQATGPASAEEIVIQCALSDTVLAPAGTRWTAAPVSSDSCRWPNVGAEHGDAALLQGVQYIRRYFKKGKRKNGVLGVVVAFP